MLQSIEVDHQSTRLIIPNDASIPLICKAMEKFFLACSLRGHLKYSELLLPLSSLIVSVSHVILQHHKVVFQKREFPHGLYLFHHMWCGLLLDDTTWLEYFRNLPNFWYQIYIKYVVFHTWWENERKTRSLISKILNKLCHF